MKSLPRGALIIAVLVVAAVIVLGYVADRRDIDRAFKRRLPQDGATSR